MKTKSKLIMKSAYVITFFEYILLAFGSFIMALSFNMFLLPNQVASGGVVGLSTLVDHIFGMEPAYTQWIINIPLFLTGLIFLGKKFGIRTAFGSMVLPLFIFLTRDFPSLTTDSLLASVFGGFCFGIGIGITLKSKGSTGGFAILFSLIHKHTGISIGKCSLMLDAMVIISAGFVFGAEQSLYSLIAIYLSSKAIDVVQIGFLLSKVALIISDQSVLIKNAVIKELGRGATTLAGYGGFTEQEKNVLLIAVSQSEVNKLKEILKKHDPNAFIIMWDSYEVLGRGFHHSPFSVGNAENKVSI